MLGFVLYPMVSINRNFDFLFVKYAFYIILLFKCFSLLIYIYISQCSFESEVIRIQKLVEDSLLQAEKENMVILLLFLK